VLAKGVVSGTLERDGKDLLLSSLGVYRLRLQPD
jgi:hypothetical protein